MCGLTFIHHKNVKLDLIFTGNFSNDVLTRGSINE